MCVCVTFCVGAGLCEGLAVGEHGRPRYRDTEDAAVLTRLVLDAQRQEVMIIITLKPSFNAILIDKN